MSSDKERDIDNLQSFLDHLSGVKFTGTLVVAFRDGGPTSISRKDELTPDTLDRFLHRPVVIKRKKAEEAEPATPEAPAETLQNITG